MNEYLLSFLMICCTIGGGCVAAMWYIRKITLWRIRWIELEHDYARYAKREPRNINDVFKD